jgi:hypothetical protein
MKKPTPETDAAWDVYLEHPHSDEGDPWGLAAKLERERDKLREERDMARAAANSFRQCAEVAFGPMPFPRKFHWEANQTTTKPTNQEK